LLLKSSLFKVLILLVFPLAIYPFELSFAPFRGISSVGRALAWHARGQRYSNPLSVYFLMSKSIKPVPNLTQNG